jgi:hypothetical protein
LSELDAESALSGESGESAEAGGGGGGGESGESAEAGETTVGAGASGESAETELTDRELVSSNGESRLLSALASNSPPRVVGTDETVVTSVIEVRSRRLIGSGSSDPSDGPAKARPLMPRADAVATAAITFQSRGRLLCWSLVCISFLLRGSTDANLVQRG